VQRLDSLGYNCPVEDADIVNQVGPAGSGFVLYRFQYLDYLMNFTVHPVYLQLMLHLNVFVLNSPLTCVVSEGILISMVEESKYLSVSVIDYPKECSG